MSRLLFLAIIATYFISCSNNPSKPLATTQATLDSSVRETRLGESNYFIQLPEHFTISEARGVEGQLGYTLIPKDSSSTMFGIVEILGGYKGFPYRDSGTFFRKSNLLNKEVDWKVSKSETEHLFVYTTEKGNVNAKLFSKNINEIDTLLSIIGTLRQK